jgi:type II secretion system protein I
MTLIEVLLALAVLALVMGAVAQLVSVGTRAALAAEETALAQLIAESKMNELASGAAAMSATGLTDYEGREGWQYSVEITPIEEPAGLVSVKVFVQQVVDGGNGVTFELYRWMPSEGFLDMALVDDPAAADDSGTTTDSGLSLSGSDPSGDSGDSP